MDYDDNISLLIHRICSGRVIFFYEDSRFYILNPNNTIKYEAEILYQQFIDNNKFNQWIKKENIPILLKKLEIWDSEDDELLKQTEKKLESNKLALYNNRLSKSKLVNIRKEIEAIKNSINKLLSRKHSLDYLTIEEFAIGKKMEFIFANTIYNSNDKLEFDNNMDKIDYDYFTKITSEIAKTFITVEQYKKIARSEIWKTIWNGNKYNVFNKAAIELTDEQKSLINISTMYDRIYEHHEAPEDFVIEDDDMLDGWMIYQKKKTEASKKESKAQDILSKHSNAKEIFIVGDQEDAEEIYSLNTATSNRIISQRKQIISRSDNGVDEIQLPDVQAELLQKVNSRR